MKTLTLGGGLTVQQGGVVEVPITTSGNFPRSNKIKVTGACSISGAVLSIDISEAPNIPDGKSFVLFDFSGATVTGTGFSQIEPARPSETQVWDTSELLTKGRILVRNDDELKVENTTWRQETEAPAFDLSGRPLDDSPRGLYIQNGKKLVRK